MLVISELGPQLTGQVIDPVGMRDRVIADIRRHLSGETGIARDDRERLTNEIADDILGYGPLERLLADDSITEIMVNGPGEIWIERQGRLYETTVRFSDDSHLRRIINRMVAQIGRRIDESSPMVDARLPDGSRVNAIIAPLSLSGPLLTIRKFSRKRLGLQDMVNIGSLSEESVDFLRRCIMAQLNVLISGGTGSGKTTLLNALSSAIPDNERIVTIEDAAELQLHQRHVLRLEARPPNIEGEGAIPIRDLVRNSLRMRPDRIIVGECRGPEALDMLQAMNTGHDGSLSTVHANAPRDALARLETMVLMAGYDLPVRAIRQQVSSALDLIVHIERMEDGSRRVHRDHRGPADGVRRDHDAGHLRVQDRLVRAGRHDQRQAPADRASPDLPRQVREARHRAAGGPVLAPPRHDERRGPPPVSRVAHVSSRWSPLAALAAAIGALPAAAADAGRRAGRRGRERAVPRPCVRPDAPASRGGSALTTDDVKVTENGKPVKNLSVLSSASAEGIGTVLLIDASNSMKGSINSAMAGGARVRRAEPGPAALGRLLQLEADRRPAADDRPQAGQGGARKAAEARRGDAASTTRSSPPSRRCAGSALGAARVVLLSDGDDVGSTTSLDAALAQLDAQKIRVYTVGIESPDFTSDDLQKIADETGGTYAAATSPEALTKIYDELGFQLGNEYLLRYRSTAQPDQNVDVEVAVKGVEPVSFAYTSPSTGTAAPYEPALRDRLLQSWLLIPLVVGLVLALVVFTIRSLWSLRSNKALVARLGDFVTLPAEEQARGAAQGGRRAPGRGRAAEAAEAQLPLDGGLRRGRRRRADQARSDAGWSGSPSSRARSLAVVAGVAARPVLGRSRGRSADRPQPRTCAARRASVRNDFGEQLPENLDVLASALRAGHSLAGAMGVVADEAPEPSKREFRRVVTDEQLGIPLDEALEVTAQADAESTTSTRSPSSRSCSARQAATPRRCSTR